MKRLAAIATCLALGVTTAACGGGAGDGKGEGVAKGGTYTTIFGDHAGIDANAPINPWNEKGNSFEGYNQMRMAWPKNSLTDPNDFYPGLAKSWEISDDFSELTVHLQPNAKWSDGKPVTTEDVKTSINLEYTQGSTAFALNPGAAGSASDIEVVDDKTIKFKQSGEAPNNVFPRNVLYETGIVPAHIWKDVLPADFEEKVKAAQDGGKAGEKAADEINQLAKKVQTFAPEKDVSAGPFVLERVNPSAALLKRNKNFYDNDKVAPDTLKLLNFSGNEQIWNMLISGELDSAPFTAVPSNVMKRIEAKNTVRKSFSPVAASLAFNQARKPYDNVHVRRALAYLIDREELVKVASPEGGTAAKNSAGMVAKAADAWLGAEGGKLEPYAKDAAKAEAELEQAGLKKSGDKWMLPDGKAWKMTIAVPKDFSDWVSAAKNMESQLGDAGIDVEVKTAADYVVYQEDIAAGKYDVGMWLTALGPSTYNIYQRLYGSSNGWQLVGGQLRHKPAGKAGNWMGSPETAEVDGQEVNPGELTQQLSTASEDEQKKIIPTLAKVSNQELPAIGLWDYVNTQFINETRFTGFPPNDDDSLRQKHGVWMQLGLVQAKK